MITHSLILAFGIIGSTTISASTGFSQMHIHSPDGRHVTDIESPIWFDPSVCTFTVITGPLHEQQLTTQRQRLASRATRQRLSATQTIDQLSDSLLSAQGEPCGATLVMDGLRYLIMGTTEFTSPTYIDQAGVMSLTQCARANSDHPVTTDGPHGQIRLNGALHVALGAPGAIVSAKDPITIYIHSLDGDVECSGIIERDVAMPEPTEPPGPTNPDQGQTIFSDRFLTSE